MDCWNCKWKKTLSWSAHIGCRLPSLKIQESDMVELLTILSSSGRIRVPPNEMVKLNPHGVRNGWANFPFEFDPIWVEECKGYEKKVENK